LEEDFDADVDADDPVSVSVRDDWCSRVRFLVRKGDSVDGRIVLDGAIGFVRVEKAPARATSSVIVSSCGTIRPRRATIDIGVFMVDGCM